MHTDGAPPRPPATTRAAAATTILGAALLSAAMLVEQFAGAALRVAFWPVFWSSALVFFAVMVLGGRQWGRVMVAVLTGLTLVLSPVLVFPEAAELDQVTRPGIAVGLAMACVACQLIGAVLAFLPASTEYVHADGGKQISPRLRKAVLVVHVTSSVAWLGIITVQGSLGITAVSTDDTGMARAMFTAMLVIDATFLGPAAFLAFFSGLVLALGTRWGLLRRWWVATKFGIMLVLMVLPIVAWQDIPIDGAALIEAGQPLVVIRDALGATPYLAMISPVLAFTAVIISVNKPWDSTLIGRRSKLAHAR